MTYADATGSGTDVVSVLIPARTEPYLQPTIDDVLAKAAGDVEVVVVLDGYWPDPPLAEHPNVVVIHHSDARGMRECINIASSVASGRYLMKLDAHCMVAEGWDEVLKADCDENTIMVPSRYGLDVAAWKPKQDKPPVEYLYLTWPYSHEPQFGTGMHGKKWCVGSTGPKGWWHLENERKDVLIDDIMIWQGSCWFMHTDTFRRLGLLDCRYSYNMFQEANELTFKIWLSGGRLAINKKTWYAHWHKDTPTGYGLRIRAKKEAEYASTWFWINDKWPLATRTFKWYIDKFWPIPSWPDDWEAQRREFEHEMPHIWGRQAFKVRNDRGHNGLGV